MTRPYRADASRRSFLRAVGGLAASAAIPQHGLPLVTGLAGMAALASQSSHAATTSIPTAAWVSTSITASGR